MNKLGDVCEKMQDGVESLIELCKETFVFMPSSTVEECFPATAYRLVVVDGKEYQLKIECTLTKCP